MTRGTALLGILVAALVVTALQLVVWAGPAFACSCRADVQVVDALADSDGAFVGVFTGRDDHLVAGEAISSGRRVTNHFLVERSVKGDVGQRIAVEAAAGGASCGLELEVGERTGLLVRGSADGWTSSLCAQTDPNALLALGPSRATETPGGGGFTTTGLLVTVGLMVLALAGALAVRRKEPG